MDCLEETVHIPTFSPELAKDTETQKRGDHTECRCSIHSTDGMQSVLRAP